MKNLFRKSIMSMALVLFLVSCSSKVNKETEKFYGKSFNGFEGGQIVVAKEKLMFRGPDPIKPVMNSKEMQTEEFKKKVEKSKLKEYKNPNVIDENGKKYLIAEGLPYKLLISADDLILDEEDNNQYRYVDLNKK